jgi:hypothetical protein
MTLAASGFIDRIQCEETRVKASIFNNPTDEKLPAAKISDINGLSEE